ncbi:MAG: peptide deformylase [Cyanobacteriota bacterium]|nr:peptide deformylase [Cyanobacteriota bacterium]
MSSEILVEKEKLKNPPLEIHRLGDKVLRQSAKRVSKVDREIKELVRQMLQTMYSSDGIGLAAPQVAVQKQVIVIDCEPDNSANKPLVLINPKIKKYGKELCVYKEGCLSIPEVFLEVKRPEAIEVAYKDETGRPQTLRADDILARVIQHEMDHLTGVLFVDRVENKLALTEELVKHKFSPSSVKSVA